MLFLRYILYNKNKSSEINEIIKLYKSIILPDGLDEDDVNDLRAKIDTLFSSNSLPVLTSIYQEKMYNIF